MGQSVDKLSRVAALGDAAPLVRRRLLPGEWWDWYVARVLDANGLAATDEYLQRILARDVLSSVGQDVAASHQVEHLSDGQRTRLGLTVLPRWSVRGPTAAVWYCPTCVRQSEYLPVRSRLRGDVCCVQHGTRLMAACHTCERRVMLWDLARERCACGATLGKEAAEVSARAPEVRLQRALDVELSWNQTAEAHLSEQPQPGVSRKMAEDGVALSVFARALLTTLSTFRTGKSGATIQKTTSQFAEEFSLVPRLEVQWFDELWSTLQIKGHLDRALMLVLKLHRAEGVAPTALSRLPLWDWAHRLVDNGASPRRAERCGLIPEGSLRQRLLTVEQAARRVGVRAELVQALVRRGKVAPTRVVGRGQKSAYFSAVDVEALRGHRPIGYEYGRALPTGIQVERMQFLRDAGLASIKADRLGRNWLDGGELRALLAGLAQRALPLQEGHGPVANLASQWIWQRRHVPAIGAVFQKLLKGEVPLWCSGLAPGFDRYFIGAEFLSELSWRSRVVATDCGLAGQRQLDLDAGWPVLKFAGNLKAKLHPLRGPIGPRQAGSQVALPF